MAWVTRVKLRENWPIVVAGGALIVVVGWFLYLRFFSHPPRFYYYPQYDETVDYRSLVAGSPPSLESYLPVAFFILLNPLSFIVLVGSVGMSLPRAVIAIGLSVFAYLISSFLCVATFIFGGCETDVKHIQGIAFTEMNYNLALITDTTSDCDAFHWTYVIYQCDAADRTCRARYIHPYNYVSLPELHLGAMILGPDGSTLHLQIDGETVYSVQAGEAMDDTAEPQG